MKVYLEEDLPYRRDNTEDGVSKVVNPVAVGRLLTKQR